MINSVRYYLETPIRVAFTQTDHEQFLRQFGASKDTTFLVNEYDEVGLQLSLVEDRNTVIFVPWQNVFAIWNADKTQAGRVSANRRNIA